MLSVRPAPSTSHAYVTTLNTHNPSLHLVSQDPTHNLDSFLSKTGSSHDIFRFCTMIVAGKIYHILAVIRACASNLDLRKMRGVLLTKCIFPWRYTKFESETRPKQGDALLTEGARMTARIR